MQTLKALFSFALDTDLAHMTETYLFAHTPLHTQLHDYALVKSSPWSPLTLGRDRQAGTSCAWISMGALTQFPARECQGRGGWKRMGKDSFENQKVLCA